MSIANSSAHNVFFNLSGVLPESGTDLAPGIQAASAVSEDSAGEAGGFWSMLSQNLSRVLAEGDQQAIENNDILAVIGEFENALQDTADAQLPAQWMHVLKSHFSELLDGNKVSSDALVSGQESLTEDMGQQIPGAALALATQLVTSAANGLGLPPGRQQLSDTAILPMLQKSNSEQRPSTVANQANFAAAEVPVAEFEQDVEFAQRLPIESAKAAEIANPSQRGLLVAADSISALKPADGSALSQLTAGLAGTSTTVSAQSMAVAEVRTLPGTLPATQPQWGTALGERISFMINQNLNSAEIRVDPPQLGKLEIQIQVKDDAASIVIHTQHAQTRDLVDAASVRLREYLQEAGYHSVDVNVSHQDSSSNQEEFNNRASGEDRGGSEQAGDSDSSMTETARAAMITVNDGRIDYFA